MQFLTGHDGRSLRTGYIGMDAFIFWPGTGDPLG
jgi:hypothetical protein